MTTKNPDGLIATSEIADELRKPYVAVRPQLYILWSLGEVDKGKTTVTDSFGRDKEVEAWKLNLPEPKQMKLKEE